MVNIFYKYIKFLSCYIITCAYASVKKRRDFQLNFKVNTQDKVVYVLQLGQPSVNPPRLVLEVGGTSTKQAAMPGELKSPPPLGTLKWGGLKLYRHSCLQG